MTREKWTAARRLVAQCPSPENLAAEIAARDEYLAALESTRPEPPRGVFVYIGGTNGPRANEQAHSAGEQMMRLFNTEIGTEIGTVKVQIAVTTDVESMSGSREVEEYLLDLKRWMMQ